MSYRGRVLVLNNLCVSLLWHRLSCLDPPPGLLMRIQESIVNFFWDGLHWVPQGVLFLPREEGGQGLIHLASRTAAFRLQFLQRFLTGPADLVWRGVASCIFREVSHLGLDTALFLTDLKFLKLNGVPPFYQSVFKVWARFKSSREKSSDSLFWLLKEPLIYGARLDVSSGATPGLTAALLRSGILDLQRLVRAAGPALTDSQAAGRVLGLRSGRVVQRVLQLWRERLTARERRMLLDFSEGAEPEPTDPFPEIQLRPQFVREGPLLRESAFSLHTVHRKSLYRTCVQVLNEKTLGGRALCAWTEKLGEVAPHWRVLYKPPLRKRTGDLQWRVLHGAIASNAFTSIINPAVSNQCPFCNTRETTFHIFSDCERLTTLFSLLTRVFRGFNQTFSATSFIGGVGYNKQNKRKWQLLNFIVGEAKMAIYVSRRNKMKCLSCVDVATVWRCNLRCRLRLEFSFYKLLTDLQSFSDIWCYKNILCAVLNDELVFTDVLRD